jgi:hypothetical protein
MWLTSTNTSAAFRLGDDDARKLAQGFSFFDAHDLQNLETGQAICRIEKANQDFNLSVPNAEDPTPGQAEITRQAVIAASRQKYATPRAEIEAAERARLRVPTSEPKTAEPRPALAPPPVEKPVEKPVRQSLRPAVGMPEPVPPPVDTDTGESQHTAIKETIGAEAVSRDYTVSYEELFPAVQGRADIVLRRGNQTIACQVTVTTPVRFEIESVRKFALPASLGLKKPLVPKVDK